MFDQLLLLEKDKALMFHCTAGKDRTGIGAALIFMRSVYRRRRYSGTMR